jgi:hypothetical protein
VTVKWHELLMPRTSVTMQVTCVEPTGKVEPEAGRQLTVTGLPQVLETGGGGVAHHRAGRRGGWHYLVRGAGDLRGGAVQDELTRRNDSREGADHGAILQNAEHGPAGQEEITAGDGERAVLDQHAINEPGDRAAGDGRHAALDEHACSTRGDRAAGDGRYAALDVHDNNSPGDGAAGDDQLAAGVNDYALRGGPDRAGGDDLEGLARLDGDGAGACGTDRPALGPRRHRGTQRDQQHPQGNESA